MTRKSSVLLALEPFERSDFLPDDLLARLKSLPVTIQEVSLPLGASADWENILRSSDCRILLSCWATPPIPEDLPIGNGARLDYVCHLAGSVRNLVPRSLVERGLHITNWGPSVSRTVAECTLLLILSALRRASFWSRVMHLEKGWKDKRTLVTQSLFGRRVGIHGFGMIAQETVPLIRPFGVPISVYSPSVPDSLLESAGVQRCDSLDALFSENDVIIELAALTPENYHIVDEKLLRRIPRDGVFVNIGRGAVVDENALARVAAEGDLQIALDVFETEPLPAESPLRGLPNVTLLPHLGGPTKDRRRDSGEFALDNLERYLAGEPLESEITLDVYDRST
jgi:phosphoglycerate dehydrogenase-like enzyme